MKDNMGKMILLIVVMFILIMCGTMSLSYKYFLELGEVMLDSFVMKYDESGVNINKIEKQYINKFGFEFAWVELNGIVTKSLGLKNYYSPFNMYIAKDNRIYSRERETTTDYEVAQMIQLKKYLDERNVDLLYVNAPTKYLKDEDFEKEFNLSTYVNRNADLFLHRIEEEGVHCLDLREKIEEEGLDIHDMFYKTDHHWTVPTGLWATKHIVKELNKEYGFHISEELYKDELFGEQFLEKCWLGEQGLKVGSSYVGLDDFSIVFPLYDTQFLVTNPYVKDIQDGATAGFGGLINYDTYTSEKGIYDRDSYHYGYIYWGQPYTNIKNLNVSDGKKILMLVDSYSQVVDPYFALGVSDITMIEMRHFNGDLKQYIDENEFDTVIILYAEFMIGSHDVKGDANYKMFQFFQEE